MQFWVPGGNELTLRQRGAAHRWCAWRSLPLFLVELAAYTAGL